MKQFYAPIMAINLLCSCSMLMPCGPATAELDTRFNAAGVFSGISGTAEIRFGTALLDLEFRGVAIDEANNIYLGGFLTTPLERFVAYKLTPTGLPVWSAALPEFSVGSSDRANGIAVDQSGCVYLGGLTDPPGGLLPQFAAAKLDNSGTLIWMTALPEFSFFSNDQANGIATDQSGCLYLGGFTIPAATPSQFAAAKLSNDGAVVWMTALPAFVIVPPSTDRANSVAVDASGCVYLGGVTDPIPAASGDARAAAAKLDNAGGLIWMTALPSFLTPPSSNDQANGIAVDDIGCVYLGGKTERALLPLMPRFVAAKLDNAGGIIWMTALAHLSGTSDDAANAIALDDLSCVYLGGLTVFGGGFNGNFAAVKLDNDGNEVWNFIVPTFSELSPSDERAFGIAVDGERAVVLAGLTDSSSRGGAAKLLQQSPPPSGPSPSPLLALPFIPMAAA